MKKLLLGAFLILSTISMSEMTKQQEAELDKLTEIFYPETNMVFDRRDFKKLQTAAYDRIVEDREESTMSQDVFNEIWEKAEKKFPGDFIQQEKEIKKISDGYRTAGEIKAEEDAREAQRQAELKEALDKAAQEDILEIKDEKNLVPQEVMEKIIANAEAEYPNDHVAQREDIENKVKAYEDMLQYFDLNSPKK